MVDIDLVGGSMKQSTDRILTTHVGSLARPHSLLDIMKEREHDRPYDAEALDREIADAVKDRVRQQVESGIDIVADGEMSKVSFLGYVKDRLGGFEVDMGASRLAPSWQAEFDMFPEYYTEYFKKYSSAVSPLRRIICKGPITLHRPEAAADRHRQPQGGVRGPRRRRHLHAVHRPQRVRTQRVLQGATRSTSTPSPRRCARSTSASSRPASSSRSTTRG